MFEIEIKAHVYNRDEVIKLLNEKAKYLGHTEKADVYYKFDLNGKKAPDGRDFLTARIRKEKLVFNEKESFTNYFTYKRKHVIQNSDGSQIEANEENEFTVGDASPLEVFFGDLGAEISLTKEKIVEQWIYSIDGEEAHVELCTVPPLGDFLEIEIMKEENDAATVEKIKKLEEKIFTICNIPLSQIEPRYYRELLGK